MMTYVKKEIEGEWVGLWVIIGDASMSNEQDRRGSLPVVLGCCRLGQIFRWWIVAPRLSKRREWFRLSSPGSVIANDDGIIVSLALGMEFVRWQPRSNERGKET